MSRTPNTFQDTPVRWRKVTCTTCGGTKEVNLDQLIKYYRINGIDDANDMLDAVDDAHTSGSTPCPNCGGQGFLNEKY